MTCDKHPRYTGKRKPKSNCETCLKIYLALKKPRIIIRPNQVMKDKTRYNRKEKHKK